MERFGYKDLAKSTKDAIEIFENKEVYGENVGDAIDSNILTRLRDISATQYIKEGSFNTDVQRIHKLLGGGNKKSEMKDDSIMEFIKRDQNYHTIAESAVSSILSVYKYLLQDGFGLRPYDGVLTFDKPYAMHITPGFRIGTIRDSETVFPVVAKKLGSRYKITLCTDRQFNLDTILKADRPVYFPAKLMEYALGRKLTKQLSEQVYKPYEDVYSWEDYESKHVKGQITELIYEVIHKCLSGVKNPSEEVFQEISTKEMVDKNIQKVIRSVCCGVVIKSYNSLGSKVNSIAIRVTDVCGTLSGLSVRDLYGSFTANMQTVFGQAECISEGRTDVNGNPLPFSIYEFRQDFDEQITSAEPLFGYKAVELYMQRGIPISWGKILLGEDYKGTPVFASLLDRDDFPLQANAVHNVIAGTRSGKGVQTMNLIASGLADNKPIFYIDRKPDMSVMFYQLSQGNMFCVNGGQYMAKNDPDGLFGNEGSAVDGWRMAYNNMPDWLKPLFPSMSYEGDFGDFVYFRAMQFVLSLLVARVELAGSEFYEKIGGAKGLIIVVDEFKNWQENFESVWLTPTGKLGNLNRLSKTARASYKKLKGDVRIAKVEMENAKNEGARLKAELKIEQKQEDMNELITPLNVYCTTVMDKLGETIKHLSGVRDAGFKDLELKLSDIFVIGQHIKIDGYDGAANKSGVYSERDSGLFNVNEDTKGKSLFRGIFNMFQHDWLMGRNVDFPTYLGADVSGSKSDRWINGKSYWGYIESASMDLLRTKEPSNMRIYKPYLVLNNHYEDDPEERKRIKDSGGMVDSRCEFVAQCRERVNDAVPGANLWDKVRLKHLNKAEGEPITPENSRINNLHPGIGFEGLTNMTKQSNGLGSFNPSEDLGVSKAIADYVAGCMGYASYRDLLFDFSPQGIFSSRDMIDAIRNPATYQDYKKRLPLFVEYDMLDSGSQEADNTFDIEAEDEYTQDIDMGGTAFEVEEYEDEPADTYGAVNSYTPQSAVTNNGDVWGGFGEEVEDTRITMDDLVSICRQVIVKKEQQYNVKLSEEEAVHAIGQAIEAVRKVGLI